MDKHKRWEQIEQNADKLFYTSYIRKPPVKIVTQNKTSLDIEKEKEISRGGRQKRKEIRKNEAQIKTSQRKSHRPLPEKKDIRFVKYLEDERERIIREEEEEIGESEEEKGSDVNVMIITNNSVPRLKAQTRYREQRNDKHYTWRKETEKAKDSMVDYLP